MEEGEQGRIVETHQKMGLGDILTALSVTVVSVAIITFILWLLICFGWTGALIASFAIMLGLSEASQHL